MFQIKYMSKIKKTGNIPVFIFCFVRLEGL